MLVQLLFGIVLIVAAWFDFKSRNVPDLVSASLWLVPILLFDAQVSWIIFSTFAATFFVVALLAWKTKKELMGWADLLMIAPFVGMMSTMPYGYLVSSIGFLIATLVAYKWKEVPLVTALTPFYWLVMALAFYTRGFQVF